MKPNDLPLAAYVDQLAILNANIKELENLAAEIKNVLIASNQQSVEGVAYKAVIKFNEPKPSVDYKKIVEDLIKADKLQASIVGFKKYLKVRVPFYSLSLYDR